ncbi:MAG: hypothetical protein KC560_10720, partial [Myxococcales bacterium]|nr:hypothetical protein [Myxococcales bacterium]
MDLATFKGLVTSFVDRPSDLDLSKGTLTLQVREEIIEVLVSQRASGVYCTESGQVVPAHEWVLERLARFQNLGRRILEFVPRDPLMIPASGHFTDAFGEEAGGDCERIDDVVLDTLKHLDSRPAGYTR